MTTTPNLDLTHLEAGTSEPDVPVNALADGLDYAMNSHLVINFASDEDHTLSTSGSVPQEWQNGTLEFTDTGVVLTTGRNVIVPDNERVYRIINNTAQILTVKTSAGTGIAVTASTGALLQCDGTNVVDNLPGVGGGDSDAIHDNVSGEIAALTTVTAASGDYLLIEDVSDSNNKKKVLASDLLGAGTDADAIHDNVAGEIAALTTVTVASGDYILVEDVSDSNNKKKVLASDLLGGGTDAAAIHDNVAAEISALTNVDVTPADYVLVEDASDSDNKKETTIQQIRAATTYSLTGTDIDPGNGELQYKTLSANTTFTESLVSGEGVTLRLAGGATYTVAWPTMTWVGGTAPTLTADDVVVIWQEQTTVFGLYVGSVA